MNPTKEELDEAIEYYEDMLNQNVPLDMEERTALTILTRYRDGELVEKDRWISVKDRLPDVMKPIDVWINEERWPRRMENCFMDKNQVFCQAQKDGSWIRIENVTHWQPLPTPPTNQTEKR